MGLEVRMRRQHALDKDRNITRHRVTGSVKQAVHAPGIEDTVGEEQRRGFVLPWAPFAIVDSHMAKPCGAMPCDGVFSVLLVVAELEGNGFVCVVQPDDEIHIRRRKPSPPVFSRDLSDVVHLSHTRFLWYIPHLQPKPRVWQ